MSPQSLEESALHGEIERCVRDIDRTTDNKSSCHAHEPMARGISTLLRCQIAALDERVEDRRVRMENIRIHRRETFAIAGAVATVAAAVVKMFG